MSTAGMRMVVILVLLCPSVARANESGVADATQQTVLASSDSGVVLEASTDEGRATAHLGMAWGEDNTVDVRLSTGTGSGSETTPGNLDGLANGASLDAGVSWFWWPTVANLELLEGCARLATELCNKPPGAIDDKVRAEACEALRHPLAEQAQYFACDSTLASPEVREAIKGAALTGPAWAIGLRAKASRSSFDYLNDVDATESSSESRYSFSASVTFGAYVSGFGYTGLNARWEHAYEGGASQSLCHAVGTMGTLACADHVIGAPTKSDELVVGAEWRGYVSAHLGVGATVSYAVDKELFGAQVPVYLLAGKDGLNGGVRLDFAGSTSALEDGDLQLTVFVGDTFSVL